MKGRLRIFCGSCHCSWSLAHERAMAQIERLARLTKEACRICLVHESIGLKNRLFDLASEVRADLLFEQG